MHLIVDEWQVGSSWTLTNSSELIVDGTVTEANPSLVGTEVWHWNATQMGANSRAAKNGGVTGIGNRGLGFFIELGGGWKSVGLVDFRLGETSDEDKLSVPRGLKNLTWWKLRNIELLVGITDIPASGDHLSVDNSDESLDSEAVVSEDETLNHVHLSTSDLVILVLLVPNSKIAYLVFEIEAYLFLSNQLSALVFTSRGSPKLDGRAEVTQNLFLSSIAKPLMSFWFFLSL